MNNTNKIEKPEVLLGNINKMKDKFKLNPKHAIVTLEDLKEFCKSAYDRHEEMEYWIKELNRFTSEDNKAGIKGAKLMLFGLCGNNKDTAKAKSDLHCIIRNAQALLPRYKQLAEELVKMQKVILETNEFIKYIQKDGADICYLYDQREDEWFAMFKTLFPKFRSEVTSESDIEHVMKDDKFIQEATKLLLNPKDDKKTNDARLLAQRTFAEITTYFETKNNLEERRLLRKHGISKHLPELQSSLSYSKNFSKLPSGELSSLNSEISNNSIFTVQKSNNSGSVSNEIADKYGILDMDPAYFLGNVEQKSNSYNPSEFDFNNVSIVSHPSNSVKQKPEFKNSNPLDINQADFAFSSPNKSMLVGLNDEPAGYGFDDFMSEEEFSKSQKNNPNVAPSYGYFTSFKGQQVPELEADDFPSFNDSGEESESEAQDLQPGDFLDFNEEMKTLQEEREREERELKLLELNSEVAEFDARCNEYEASIKQVEQKTHKLKQDCYGWNSSSTLPNSSPKISSSGSLGSVENVNNGSSRFSDQASHGSNTEDEMDRSFSKQSFRGK
jgi:hypothetical protein